MAYIELQPRALTLDELTTIHNAASDLGHEATADILMDAYWLKRTEEHPIEESIFVSTNLLMYDEDWKRLIKAGVKPLTEDDPRIGTISDEDVLPAFTNLIHSIVFKSREGLKTRWIALAEGELVKDRLVLRGRITEAIDRVGIDRVNGLLSIIGVKTDQSGSVAYEEVDGEQMEGVREVVRLMSSGYRDLVRMNPRLMSSSDREAVQGTDIEGPETKAAYNALLRALGFDDK